MTQYPVHPTSNNHRPCGGKPSPSPLSREHVCPARPKSDNVRPRPAPPPPRARLSNAGPDRLIDRLIGRSIDRSSGRGGGGAGRACERIGGSRIWAVILPCAVRRVCIGCHEPSPVGRGASVRAGGLAGGGGVLVGGARRGAQFCHQPREWERVGAGGAHARGVFGAFRARRGTVGEFVAGLHYGGACECAPGVWAHAAVCGVADRAGGAVGAAAARRRRGGVGDEELAVPRPVRLSRAATPSPSAMVTALPPALAAGAAAPLSYLVAEFDRTGRALVSHSAARAGVLEVYAVHAPRDPPPRTTDASRIQVTFLYSHAMHSKAFAKQIQFAALGGRWHGSVARPLATAVGLQRPHLAGDVAVGHLRRQRRVPGGSDRVGPRAPLLRVGSAEHPAGATVRGTAARVAQHVHLPQQPARIFCAHLRPRRAARVSQECAAELELVRALVPGARRERRVRRGRRRIRFRCRRS
eukprot:ctg_28.g36